MAKRTNGEGTIYKDKNGLWRAEITIGYDTDGKRIAKKKASKDLTVAQKWLNDERARLNRGIIVLNSDYTVESWLLFWLETYKRVSVKAKTFDLYDGLLRGHVLPSLGSLKLSRLKGENIQMLYNEMFNNGLSTSTIKNVHKPLSQALEQAITNEILYVNPCKKVLIPKRPPRESRAFTVDEQKRFTDALDDSTTSAFFAFAFQTGMRCMEIAALTWQDVDTEHGNVYVRKTMSIVNDRESTTRRTKTIADTPKTAKSKREVPISNAAMAILTTQRQKAECAIYVFATKNGTPIMYRNLRRSFDAIKARAELPKDLTIHSTRHTFATRLLEKGANMKAISDILGHTSIKITMDTYGHVQQNMKREAINLLNE